MMKHELHVYPILNGEHVVYMVYLGEEYLTIYTSWEQMCNGLPELIETELKLMEEEKK